MKRLVEISAHIAFEATSVTLDHASQQLQGYCPCMEMDVQSDGLPLLLHQRANHLLIYNSLAIVASWLPWLDS